MATIDISYFFGDLTIAQKSTDSVASALQWHIDQREPEFMELLLGKALYILYKATPGNYADLTAMLFKVNGTSKISPVANYIYYWYMRNAASKTTGTGEKVVKAENAVDNSAHLKAMRAWNEMVSMNKKIVDYLSSTIEAYEKLYPFSYSYYAGEQDFYNDRVNILTRIPLF